MIARGPVAHAWLRKEQRKQVRVYGHIMRNFGFAIHAAETARRQRSGDFALQNAQVFVDCHVIALVPFVMRRV